MAHPNLRYIAAKRYPLAESKDLEGHISHRKGIHKYYSISIIFTKHVGKNIGYVVCNRLGGLDISVSLAIFYLEFKGYGQETFLVVGTRFQMPVELRALKPPFSIPPWVES